MSLDLRKIEGDFEILMRPLVEVRPYVIFVDDFRSNFTVSSKILGLLSPSNEKTPTQTPVLSNRALKQWQEQHLYQSYDAESGIPTKGFRTIRKFIQKNKADISSIIFDWDKTLTVHSSFRAINITKETMEGYFGGKPRMNAIKHFFQVMRRLRVSVIILTSNPRSRYDTQSFKRALSFVSGEWVPIYFTDNIKTTYINRKF